MKSIALPIIDSNKCIKCDKCIDSCPRRAIIKAKGNMCNRCIKYCMTMQVPCAPEHYIFEYNNCDSCGICLNNCPAKAISWFEKENSIYKFK